MKAALFHNFDTEGLKEVVECLESLEIFIDKDAHEGFEGPESLEGFDGYNSFEGSDGYKVNRCLARYSPRATTTNRPTNRALNKPAWPGLN